jgi:hypothetical protein
MGILVDNQGNAEQTNRIRVYRNGFAISPNGVHNQYAWELVSAEGEEDEDSLYINGWMGERILESLLIPGLEHEFLSGKRIRDYLLWELREDTIDKDELEKIDIKYRIYPTCNRVAAYVSGLGSTLNEKHIELDPELIENDLPSSSPALVFFLNRRAKGNRGYSIRDMPHTGVYLGDIGNDPVIFEKRGTFSAGFNSLFESELFVYRTPFRAFMPLSK